MNVDAVAEGRLQRADIGDMGEQAQLDLAVVGADQHMPRRRDEGGADLPAFLGADGDVLDVGIARRQPPCRGGREGERGVHTPGMQVDIARQRVGISALQL